MATAINQGQALRCAGLISGRQLQPRWQMRDAGAAAGTDGQYAHDGGAIVSVALIIGIFWLLRGSLKLRAVRAAAVSDRRRGPASTRSMDYSRRRSE
jgi:hypothetical protein